MMIEKRSDSLLLWMADPKQRLMRFLTRSAPFDRPLAELSCGSAALALARLAAERRQRCRLYLPPVHADRAALESLGAELRFVPLEQALAELEEDHRRGKVYWTRQNFNPDAPQAYREAFAPYSGLSGVRIVVGAVGTGASLMALAQTFPDRPVLALFSRLTPGMRCLAGDLGPGDQGSRAHLERALGDRLYCLEVGPTTSAEAVKQATVALRGALGLVCHTGSSSGLRPAGVGRKVGLFEELHQHVVGRE